MSEAVIDDADRPDTSEIETAFDEIERTNPESAASTADEKRLSGNGGSKSKPDLTSLIASKISELEKETNKDEEEDKDIARAVKAEHRKLSNLVSETDTEIGKVTLLQRKYTTLFQDMQRLEREHARQRAKSEKIIKEFSASKVELSKAVNMKHKLETLCRELQKENKRVKEDSKRLAHTEQQKRVELNSKFETTIHEIKTKMDEDSGLSSKRRLEDGDLKDKFDAVIEHYTLRENQLVVELRMKELEAQMSQARLEQFKRASESNEMRAKTLHSQVSTFSETESELRSQLNIYVDKFKQVEDTLNNSNDLFLNFRKEMESMTKKTKKLEKENALIRSKCDTANKSILEMAEERAKYRKEIEALKQKSGKLENLCRALQRERTSNTSRTSTTPGNAIANGDGADAASQIIATDSQAPNTNGSQIPHDEHSDGSLEDNYSEASFELENDSLPVARAGETSHNPIAGFLKVSDAEEKMIREKRRDYFQPTHSSPDRDADGYLAVSHLEKDFISAFRDSKLYNSEISGQPMSSDMMQNLRKLHDDLLSKPNGVPRTPLTEQEKELYQAAADRLANMSQSFMQGHANLDALSRLPQFAMDADLSSGNRNESLLETFKHQLTHEQLDDFSKHFADMLDICKNNQSFAPNRDIYDALMTAAAILLPDAEIAALKRFAQTG